MNKKVHTSRVEATKGVAVRFLGRVRTVKIQPFHTQRLSLAVSTIIFSLALVMINPQVCWAPLQNATFIDAASTQSVKAMEIENQIQRMFSRFHLPVDVDLVHEMTTVGLANHVDPRLVAAIIVAESSGNPLAVSNQHAIGLMQINARIWAHKLDFSRNNPFDPATNVQMGISILRNCVDKYQWLDSALAAYVGDAQFSDDGTRVYVNRIIHIFERASGNNVPRNPAVRMAAPKAVKVNVGTSDLKSVALVKTAFQGK